MSPSDSWNTETRNRIKEIVDVSAYFINSLFYLIYKGITSCFSDTLLLCIQSKGDSGNNDALDAKSETVKYGSDKENLGTKFKGNVSRPVGPLEKKLTDLQDAFASGLISKYELDECRQNVLQHFLKV